MNGILNKIITSRLFDRVISSALSPYVTIFTLHRSTPSDAAFKGTDEKLLEECLRFATQQGFQFLSIDQIVADALAQKTYSKPVLCFTLDDGYEDQLTQLTPILLKYGAQPTLFVITDMIDQRDWTWDAKISHLTWRTPLTQIQFTLGEKTHKVDLSTPEHRKNARRFIISKAKQLPIDERTAFINNLSAYCQIDLTAQPPKEYTAATWDQLREAEAQGLRIGSHTQSHLVFNAASAEQITQELAHSRARLQAELRSPSQVFCYPLGSQDDISFHQGDLVKAAHYTGAITTISNTTSLKAINEKPYYITRIGFPFTFEHFVRYASWAEAIRSKIPF